MRYFYRMEIEGFRESILPLRNKLTGIAISILHNADDAEDAVQETYLRLWKNRNELSKHPNIGGYAALIVKNICIDKLRRKRECVSVEQLECASGSSNPHVIAEEKDNSRIIGMIIDTLPELQKNILMMRDVEGYELNEIAEITASSVAAVTVNLSRARKKVREKFLKLGTIGQKI